MFKVIEPLLRLRSLTGTLVIFLSSFLLTACIVTADQSVEGNPKDPRAQDIADRVRSIDLTPRQTADVGGSGVALRSAQVARAGRDIQGLAPGRRSRPCQARVSALVRDPGAARLGRPARPRLRHGRPRPSDR